MKRVVFICTGNFYRSRLAEILFNHHAQLAGLDWSAESRGILCENLLRGMSDSAFRYLEKIELTDLLTDIRDPRQLKIQDLEDANLIVALNEMEHEPMLKARMGSVPRTLKENGKLIYWNVGDIPIEAGPIARLLDSKINKDRQSETSGTEHIHCAIRCLIADLVAQESQTPGS